MIATLLLLLAPCAAPELKVPAEVKAEPAEFARVSAETTGKTVKWVSLDKGLALFPADLLKDSRTAVVIARNPGRYRLLAITANGDEISEPAMCVVVVGDAPVPPGPAPGPEPQPGPLARVWVVVIEETSASAASRGAFWADRDLVAYIEAKKWKVRVADQDAQDSKGQTPKDLAPYIARAKTKALPHLMIVDPSGKPIAEGTLPATPAELLAELKKIGG